MLLIFHFFLQVIENLLQLIAFYIVMSTMSAVTRGYIDNKPKVC